MKDKYNNTGSLCFVMKNLTNCQNGRSLGENFLDRSETFRKWLSLADRALSFFKKMGSLGEKAF